MKFRVISDIHNEFFSGSHYHLDVIPGESEMCLIMAGDIGLLSVPLSYEAFIQEMCSRHKYVFWIEGNHEFYLGVIGKHSIGALIAQMKCNEKWSNLYTASLPFEEEKIVVLGCTLWTNFDNGNPMTLMAANAGMSDFHSIRTKDGSKFRAEHALDLHQEQKKKLFSDIEHYKNNGYRVVVVTHHQPSFKGISPEHRGDALNGAFCSELFDDIRRTEPDYWVCGHVHHRQDYMIHNTVVTSNPCGYLYFDEKTGFTPEHCFEIK